jgi:hypothetical protein
VTQLDHLQLQLNKIRQRALIVGALALAACLFGAIQSPAQFFQSYLLGFLFWFGIAIGCLGLVMLHHLVAGGWGFVIQRLLEAGSRTLPLMLLLFVPLYLGMQELYLWARPEAVSGDELLQHKSVYLNAPFFGLRALGYFAVWMIFAFFLNKWSATQDRTADPSLTRRIERISGPGLVALVLTISFAAIDWVMSLDPHWFSTIFGVLFVVGQGLSTLAFAIIVVNVLAKHKPLSEVISARQFHDLGTLMFAFVMLWAYVAFSQFLIIWSGNLPEEIPWYLHRLHGGWQVLAIALLVFHFALPFVLLLSRRTKRKAEILAKVAIAMIAARFVDLFWIVVPNFHSHAFSIHWMDLLAPIGMGGIWIAVFVWQLQGRALLPLHDPRLKEAFHQE